MDKMRVRIFLCECGELGCLPDIPLKVNKISVIVRFHLPFSLATCFRQLAFKWRDQFSVDTIKMKRNRSVSKFNVVIHGLRHRCGKINYRIKMYRICNCVSLLSIT